jgi:hypothetical protein
MVVIALLTSEGSMAHDDGKYKDRSGTARGGASREGHDRAGFATESPYSRPKFYYWPYYSFQPDFSPSTIMPPAPPAYIDQGTALNIQSLGPISRDYCSSPAGYYPYVQECPAGWRRIEPQPIEQQPGYWYYCTNPQGSYPYNRECSTIWRNVVP